MKMYLKKITVLLSILFMVHIAFAQSNPVSWKFSAKKIGDKTFEVHLKATTETPWHIYSQFTPDGGPVQTKFAFNKNPLLLLVGKAKENGKMITKHEDVFGVDVEYFEGAVDFVQIVKVKGNVKTALSGKVEYMTCNDKECLPPTESPIRLELK